VAYHWRAGIENSREPLASLNVPSGAGLAFWLQTRYAEGVVKGIIGERREMGGKSMVLEFDVVIEKDEDGYYVASIPALRGCHTQAQSLDALMRRIREAIDLCLEVEEPVSNEFVGMQRVAVTR